MVATDAVRAQAWKCHQNGAHGEAERLYRDLLNQQPEESDAANLGALLRGQGRLKEAHQHYQLWLPRFSSSVNLALNATNCAIEAGALSDAQQWLEQGLRSHPQEQSLRQAQARLLQAQGQGELAATQLEELCRHAPQDPSVWLDLGLARHRLEQRDRALEAFREAGRLTPNDPRAAANQITLLQELGRWQDAEQLIANLPADVRQSSQVRGAVAHLLMERQLLVEAASEFAALCSVEPQQPLHWLNRTACLRQLKHGMAALAVAKQGMVLHPQHQDLRQALAQCLADVGRHQQALALLEPDQPARGPLSSQLLFSLQFLGAGYGLVGAQQRAELAQQWEQNQQQKGVGALWGDRLRPPVQGRPLRVGYLSADFCNHPVGRFLLPVLEAHNPAAVEVVGLSCGPHQDAVQAQLQRHCQHWVNLRHATDLEAARLVSDLQLDVVVELGGYTAGSRLDILCHRPAAVQLSYLGYFAPTYLSCIDGWIGDAVLFGGLNAVDRQAQALLLVEGGYMAYRDPALPEPQRGAAKRFRFGSFNHARKLSRQAVELFCGVMAAVPEAELVLKSISFVEQEEQARIRALFTAAGLASERLILLPWMEGRSAHLDRYREIDVALDPLPYGGATTTCEALAMGVPVVSLAGAGMVGRLSASVLQHAGCGAWIADSTEGYVAIAQQLAATGPRRQDQRQDLRQQVLTSDLGNGPRLAQELERLYRLAATRVVNASSS